MYGACIATTGADYEKRISGDSIYRGFMVMAAVEIITLTPTEVQIAFAAWYIHAWDRSPYDRDEDDMRVLLEKFRHEWLPALQAEHCGDCTKVPAPCTRCHMEEYARYAKSVSKLTS
jgi:hypothetical protein